MEYLEEMIAKYKKTDLYSDDENKIFNEFKKYFEEQFLKIYSNGNFNTASALASRNPLDVQQSGSRKKGTCIKGHSDLDMFFSITDYNGRTCEQYYNDLFDITKKTKYNGKLIASRKQRFSIGFEINGIDIDIVPALKITNFGSSDDHFLFNSKKHSLQKTNIKKQIDYVKNSGYQGVIILLKLWKKCWNVDISSCYLEYITIRSLKNSYYHSYTLPEKLRYVLNDIYQHIESWRIQDPANPSNIISNGYDRDELSKISSQAKTALSKLNYSNTNWEEIIW